MTGPYIVTTSMASMRYGANGKRITTPVSRVAVATLDDARYAIGIEAGGRMGRPVQVAPSLIVEVASIPESGGTITLPDGTVIEVEAITDNALADMIAGHGFVWPAKDEDTLRRQCDAFNAQEAKR